MIIGAANLKADERVISAIKYIADKGLVCAICAAPIALAEAGILKEGASVTCYPGFEYQLGKINYTDTLSAVEENIITGKGPAAVFEFASRVAEALGEKQSVEKVLKGMLV